MLLLLGRNVTECRHCAWTWLNRNESTKKRDRKGKVTMNRQPKRFWFDIHIFTRTGTRTQWIRTSHRTKRKKNNTKRTTRILCSTRRKSRSMMIKRYMNRTSWFFCCLSYLDIVCTLLGSFPFFLSLCSLRHATVMLDWYFHFSFQFVVFHFRSADFFDCLSFAFVSLDFRCYHFSRKYFVFVLPCLRVSERQWIWWRRQWYDHQIAIITVDADHVYFFWWIWMLYGWMCEIE